MKLTERQSAIALFLSLCFLWSFTWIMGKYQINNGILPEVAVSYRFIGVSIMMLIIAKILKQSIKVKIKDLKILFNYAILCASIHFILFYYAAGLMVTSISAIIFSFSIIIIAIIKHFLKISSENIFVIIFSAIIGSCGLFFIMMQKLNVKFDLNLEYGILIVLTGTIMYSIGSIYYERRTKHISTHPIVSFFYVSIFSVIIGFIIGVVHSTIINQPMNFVPNFTVPFLLSYIYLVFSGIGTLFMMLLIQKVGSVKASYINLITPVGAIVVSALLEDYTILPSTVIGVVFIVLSNYIALRAKVKAVK